MKRLTFALPFADGCLMHLAVTVGGPRPLYARLLATVPADPASAAASLSGGPVTANGFQFNVSDCDENRSLPERLTTHWCLTP